MTEIDPVAIWKELGRHRNTLFGNGRSGLTDRMAAAEQVIRFLEKAEERRKNREWAVILMVAMLVIKSGWDLVSLS